MTDEPRWTTDDRRRDGLRIVAGIDGFIIMPQSEGLPVDACPVCDRPFPKTPQQFRAAKLVAEALYPLADLNGSH